MKKDKKILGLDLGVASIGWAVIIDNEEKKEIKGMGVRIVPYSTADEKDDFAKGTGDSKNKQRTQDRTARKCLDRYQLRRKYLVEALNENGMMPSAELIHLKREDIWKLRSRAASEKISLLELGRVLLHLNQKRGYKSSRSEANMDKKDTDYVQEVKNRHQKLKETGLTIGQFFFNEISKDQNYKIREQIFPREAYIDEYNSIMLQQAEHHKAVTKELTDKIRDEIIYFQRKLKSQKGLVSICEFEGKKKIIKDKDSTKPKEILIGPKTAPKSSPLFQLCKIWESVNNIKLQDKYGKKILLTKEQKTKLVEHLDTHERMSFSEMCSILGPIETKAKPIQTTIDLIPSAKKKVRNDSYYADRLTMEKGIQGNLTKSLILNLLKDLPNCEELLRFTLNIDDLGNELELVDKKTGEIKTTIKKIIQSEIVNEPLYKIWHIIYSVSDKEECANALHSKFGIPKEIAEKLASIDFTKSSFGNKSAKAMRKILPYLMEGFVYSEACELAGYNHSNSLTKQENLERTLKQKLELLPKNTLRQPIVEKILNQMINLVNALVTEYGSFDEIRVELARELKQSKEDRNSDYANNNKRERENETIKKRLAEYNIKATRKNVIKWRLFHYVNNDESKVNNVCLYCGEKFGITDALKGIEVDVEHIIPKAKMFDDSQNNKILAHRACNALKTDMTAYDYMSKNKPTEKFNAYIDEVKRLFEAKIISKAKRDKLLMPESDIPTDFIDRQLRESQYIAKKAKEILSQICYDVYTTTGSITAHLRKLWGWEDALMNVQLPKYRALGLVEQEEYILGNKIHQREVIQNWSKRDDHRHHAVDALTIACTKQGFIQRLNTLNSEQTRNEMFKETQNFQCKDKLSLLDKYLILQRPFKTSQIEESIRSILISFKAGKKVATFGKRKVKQNGKKVIVQTGIVVPRGQLSEESVYGKIKVMEKEKPLKYIFENPELIVKDRIRKRVEERLAENKNELKKALDSLKKKPIFLDKDMKIELKHATCFKDEYVYRYSVAGIFDGKENEEKALKKVESVIDKVAREKIKQRLYDKDGKFRGTKEPFKDLETNPIWLNEEKGIKIKTVRCFTGLSAVEPIAKNEKGEAIGFVKPGNNHHIAIYLDEKGARQEHVVTFWHAVERKKYGIPVIIENPTEIWDKILNNPEAYPKNFIEKLPKDKWKLEFSMQQNEMFVLGLKPEDFDNAIQQKNYKFLADYIYRVQKIGSGDYTFRQQYETQLINDDRTKKAKLFYRITSIKGLFELNPKKIRINVMGEIVG